VGDLRFVARANAASREVASLLEQAAGEQFAGEVDAWRETCAAAIAIDPTPRSRYAFAAWLADVDELDEAIRQLELAWELAKSRQDCVWRTRCCHGLADLHRAAGRPHVADRYRQLALRAELDAGEHLSANSWMRDRAHDAFRTGDHDAAEHWLRRASDCDSERTVNAGAAAFDLAAVRARQGRGQAALRTFVRAIQAFRKQRNRRAAADALVNMGHVLQGQERWSLAKTCFRGAARLYRQLGAEPAARRVEDWARESRSCEAVWGEEATRN
jgi:tetratricopeptide (TPR) repeat protein